MLIARNYDSIGITKKTVIYIIKLSVVQYWFVFDIRYYLKLSLIYSKL